MKPDTSCELCGAQPPTNYEDWRLRAKAGHEAGFRVVWEHSGCDGGIDWNGELSRGCLHTAHIFSPACAERAIAWVKQHGVIDNGDRLHPYHAIRPALTHWIRENCAAELRY